MNLQSDRQSGFTLIEATIAAVLVSVLAYLVMTMSKTGFDAQNYSQRMSRVTEIAQEMIEEIRDDAQSSVHLFGADATGQAYVTILDTTGLPSVIAGSRLPQIVDGGVFEVDGAADVRTGNSLALARHAWADEFQATSGDDYRIDVYRIVYYYMTEVDGGPQDGQAYGLNVVQWISEPVANGNQIDNIDDPTDRAEVCEHLRVASADAFGNTHTPVQAIWKIGDDPAATGTFRQIISGGSLVDAPQSPRATGSWKVYPDLTRSRVGMLHYRFHSLATNFAPPICGVAKYGYQTTTGSGFPHGFETQIVGPSSARKILLHVSVVSTHTGRLAWHDSQTITDARDL
ncbi:MAG: type II secretion system protein [Planctomycetes bacterium]|nr:type II secretion system protein [Planctomycetota bacterium]